MTTPAKLDLATITLDSGAHENPADGMCVMEAVALLAGEEFSDHPACTSPVIGAYLRSWNDGLEEEPRQRLKPYALKVLGTNTGPADDEVRAWLATDWLVRVQTPAWLDLAGLKDEAAELRNLPALTSSEIAVACQSVIENARTKAGRAATAARDAARDAAWAAARDAARDAAWAAARDAARDAVEELAASKKIDASGLSYDEAYGAAKPACVALLAPTLGTLERSAIKLIEAMLAVTPESLAATSITES